MCVRMRPCDGCVDASSSTDAVLGATRAIANGTNFADSIKRAPGAGYRPLAQLAHRNLDTASRHSRGTHCVSNAPARATQPVRHGGKVDTTCASV